MIINPGKLTLSDLKTYLAAPTVVRLSDKATDNITQSAKAVENILASAEIVYGINTGFGGLANVVIDPNQLEQLQTNLVLSHATGVGPLLDDRVVRTILLLKINALSLGYSGIQLSTVEALITCLNHDMLPCIPSQGSVGASGDLAPLAHMAAALLGFGQFRHRGEIVSAEQGLKTLGIKPLTLRAKEGLALLNGTQVSTALAVTALFETKHLFNHALITGCMSLEAAGGSDKPFDERIHRVRNQPEQQEIAKRMRELLGGSQIRQSHVNCAKVQDPYSLRCQPQVMGACLERLNSAEQVLAREVNACTDNPLIFINDDGEDVISGGNFHAEPTALIADSLALVITEIGNISERRIAMLMDTHFTDLPMFLVKGGGVNSGFMIAHYTTSALASENKSLATPCSADTIPTSANQEDHVSMATHAAMRLHRMNANLTHILAVEWLAGAQGVELRQPLTTSPLLAKSIARLREKVAFYDKDRYFADDINAASDLLMSTL